jgi:16S rRNA (cytidine1402-2'-O)-methyltransferase
LNRKTALNASFVTALAASREAAGEQHYPVGALYIVATPIGNLSDITLRALHVLQLADAVACEDTRHTQTLLRAYGIERSSSHLIPVHQHNESEAAQGLIERLQTGQRIVYVSDAGTPAISDPGARLVADVRGAGLSVIPLPGASSVIAALSVAGIVQSQAEGFVFVGFLPSKSAERDTALSIWAQDPRTLVLLEAPHRIEALAGSLQSLGNRRLTVARELTKQFEEIATLSAHELPAWLSGNPNRTRGEFVLVLHPLASDSQSKDEPALKVLGLLLPELPLKTAARSPAPPATVCMKPRWP